MHQLEMHEVSPEFARCWQAAGRHIETQLQGPLRSWIKVHLKPPFLEHLSFRLGNQLFFIRIEDVDGRLDVPGNRLGLASIADGCEGYGCLMPMRRVGLEWQPDFPGCGLIDVRSGVPLDPVSLVSDERIEMTGWEVQDVAVQIVRQELERMGRPIMSWQSNPLADPSIWFVGNEGPEWIVVRGFRGHPAAPRGPDNLRAIAEKCAALSNRGHFGPVFVANPEDVTNATRLAPLWRGHALSVWFDGLQSVTELLESQDE